MQQHELWAGTIKSKSFEIFLKALDGARAGEFSLAKARAVVQRENRFFSALDFWTWQNNAYHAGIITEEADGTLRLDSERLAEVRAMPVSKAGWITIDCCFQECKG